MDNIEDASDAVMKELPEKEFEVRLRATINTKQNAPSEPNASFNGLESQLIWIWSQI